MTSYFQELFEYNHHFNQQLITIFVEQSHHITEKANRLFNHVINAHQIWNSRILNQHPFGVWDIHDPQDLSTINHTNHNHTQDIIDHFDLLKIVDYSNSKGQAYTNTIQDILFHVINHSTYHKGQIASEFKRMGLDPLIMDYIIYKRIKS